jgi:hypothetical protein
MINPLTHRKILKNGTPGRAAIVAIGTMERGSTSFNLPMTLQVHVQGIVPYEVEDQWMVKARDAEALSGSIPVKIDPDEHDRVAIDWDLLREEFAREKEARRAALAAQGPVGTSWPGSDPFAGAAPTPGDGAAQGVTPVIDMRNDPELRRKIEEVLGRELIPGSTETIATEDPMLQLRIMQVVQEHMAQLAGQAPVGTATQAPGVTGSGQAGEDSLARLERLAALRAAGALTDAEFEAEKRKIIGGQ